MTKFHFAGRYNGDSDSLITQEHMPDYVPFKEAQDMNKLSIIMTLISLLILAVTLGLYYYLTRTSTNWIAWILALVVLVPHEFLHGICFPEDVYMYENLKKGMLFVVGPGTFSKAGFVFMSLLPNIVFGLIPYVIFLFDHSQTLLGTFGAINIAAGAGDYYNVFNALTQMPKGSRTYMHGFNSFWYMPQNKE